MINKILCAFFAGISVACFIASLTMHSLQTKITILRATLADPHHCVSVCADEFAKWGC